MKLPLYPHSALALSLLCFSSVAMADVDKAWDAFDRADVATSFAEFKVSAENHEKDAAFIYGSLLLNRSFSEHHQKQGRAWLQKAADQGDARAAYNLAYDIFQEIKDSSWNDDHSHETSVLSMQLQQYMHIALDANLPEAYSFMIEHGYFHQKILGIQDFKEIARYIQKAHEIQPTSQTYFNLGVVALQGPQLSDDLPYEPYKAAEYFEKAYQKGANNAVYILRDLYDGDYEGFAKNKKKYNDYSKIYYENFAELNHNNVLFESQEISPLKVRLDQTEEQVLSNLKKQSEHNSDAARILGAFSKDKDNAREYFQKAIDLGDENAVIALYYSSNDLYSYDDQQLNDIKQLADSGNLDANILLSEILYGEEALPYLTVAADLGHADSMLKFGQYYGNEASYDPTAMKKALARYNQLIEQFPQNHQAYAEKAWLLYKDVNYRERTWPEILAGFEQAVALSPNDTDILMRFAYIYNDDHSHNDHQKALALYEQVAQLSNDPLLVNTARLYQAQLLKYGKGNVIKDEVAANALYAQSIEEFPEDPEASYELADSYHYGKGIEKDIDQAIQLYRITTLTDAQLPLGLLLAKSPDETLQSEGLSLITNIASYQKTDAEVETLLLSFKDRSPAVQDWLLKMAIEDPYRLSFDAVAVNKDGCDADIIALCVNHARWMMIHNKDIETAVQMLNEAASKGDSRAIQLLLEHNRLQGNESAREALLLQLVKAKPSDENYQAIAEWYLLRLDYDEAEKWYQKIQALSTQADYDLARIQDEREYFNDMIVQAQTKDPEAVQKLFLFYKYNKRRDLAVDVLEKWGDLDNETVLSEWIEQLDQINEPAQTAKATEQTVRAVLTTQKFDFFKLHQRYMDGIDPNITRTQLQDWLTQYAVINPKDAESYQHNMTYFDDLVAQSKSEDQALKINALENLLYAYQNGANTPKKQAELLKIYAELAELGDHSSAYQMGEYYRKGESVAHNWEKAVHYYRFLPEDSYYSAQEYIEFYDDVVVPASKGDLKAEFELGQYYLKDYAYEDQPALREAGYDAVLKAADHNIVEAQYYLSTRYDYRGISSYERDQWLQKAAKNGHKEAQISLAQRLEAQAPLSDEQVTEIVKLYEQAAKTDKDAQLKLLAFYYSQNRAEDGAKILAQLSPQDQVYQHISIALWYQYGYKLLPVDIHKAVEFYQKSYQSGDLKSGLSIVDIYLNDALMNKEADAMILLEEVLEKSYQSDDIYVIDNAMPMISYAIKGTKGFSNDPKTQQFGIQWAEKMLTKGDQYAAMLLGEYYQTQGDIPKAYFYLKLVDSWAVSDLMSEMSEEEILQQNEKVRAYQQKLGWRY